ncbi:hypothetical protein GCM10027298_28560 [Epidermidibacterium keratini]
MKAKLIVAGAAIFTVVVAVAALFLTGVLPPTDSSAADSTTTASETIPPIPPTSSAPVPLARTLLSIDETGNVVLARTGSCDSGTPASVQTITPGGEVTDMPNPPAEVLRVVANNGFAFMVGADAACEVVAYSNDDAGSWISGSAEPSNWWYLPPGGLGPNLESGAGPVYVDCTVVAISVLQVSNILVGCDDGRIRATANRGLTWTDPGSLPGLVDLAFTDPQTGFALAPTDDCAGAVLQTTDGGASWAQLACIDNAQPGALAVSGSQFAAVVGDKLWRSDDGATWTA